MRRSSVVPVLAVAAALGGCGGGDAPAPSAPLVRAVADVRVQGTAVPRSFIGFSQDPAIVVSETGWPVTGVNPVLVALYRNLAAAGAGPPVLRIGGNGQDSAWWNPRGRPRPLGITIDLTPRFLRSVGRFLAAARTRAIFGLNLAIDRPEVPAEEARAVVARWPARRLLGFELGNEPNVYPHRVQGRDREDRRVYARRPGYSFADYLPELERSLRPLRGLPVAAPSVCCSPWLEDLPELLRRDGEALRFVSLHRYPLQSCGSRPGDSGYPRAATLLAPDVMAANVRPIAAAVAAARRRGLDVRVTETNSVACGGGVGVSDRFPAALWAVDWMFNLAAAGVRGVNFHGSSPLYQPFRTGFTATGYRAIVKPLYYGLLLFAQAAPHRARLLPRAHAGARTRRGAQVRVWAAVDRVDGVVRVVLLNEGLTGGDAVLRVPFAAGAGTVERLLAPRPLAADGITWGGRSFASPTSTGRLAGRAAGEHVPAAAGDRFRFALPAASAALLTVPVSRTNA